MVCRFGHTTGSMPISLAPGWALEAFTGKVSAKIPEVLEVLIQRPSGRKPFAACLPVGAPQSRLPTGYSPALSGRDCQFEMTFPQRSQ
ncbi:MAG: hypothetical protein HY774_22435 [Acidobacteria bacterium]|nr:hypothetical protein [Acidobacteriota bacterium]